MMNNNIDDDSFADTIIAKSDQLNASDLILNDIIIKIEEVRKLKGDKDQPIHVYYEGCDGRPFKPCKIMRRAIPYFLGDSRKGCVGKYMKLYRDPTAKWSGKEVGGVRIKGFYPQEKDEDILCLQESRGVPKPHKFKRISIDEIKKYESSRGREFNGSVNAGIKVEKQRIDIEPLKLGAEDAVLRGSDALKDWFMSLTNDERIVIKPLMEEYKNQATQNDEEGILDE